MEWSGRAANAGLATSSSVVLAPTSTFYRISKLVDHENSYFGSAEYPADAILSFMSNFGKRQCCVTHFDALRGILYNWLRPEELPKDAATLRELLRRHGAGIHFGVIVTGATSLAAFGANSPLNKMPAVRMTTERELVFDIDLRDKHERHALCTCDTASACQSCWLLVELGVAILRQLFTGLCDLGPPLVVFSGGKGAHVWFGNKKARELSLGKRQALTQFLRNGATAAPVKEDLSSPWNAFMDRVLAPMFVARGLEARGIWSGDKSLFGVYVRRVFGPEIVDKAEAAGSTGIARWKALTDLVPAQRLRAFLWQFAWPVVDAGVLAGNGVHMLKAPFSLHHTTLRVALPLDDDMLRGCDPRNMPQLPLQFHHGQTLRRARDALDAWLRANKYA